MRWDLVIAAATGGVVGIMLVQAYVSVRRSDVQPSVREITKRMLKL